MKKIVFLAAFVATMAQAQDIHQLTAQGLCPVNADVTVGVVGRYAWSMHQCRPPSTEPLTTRYWWAYYGVVDLLDLPARAPEVISAFRSKDRFKTVEIATQSINRPLSAPEFAPALAAAKKAYAEKAVPRLAAPDGKACACDSPKSVWLKDKTPMCPTAANPTGPLVVCKGM